MMAIVTNKNPIINIVDGLEIRLDDNLGDRKQGTQVCFPTYKQKNEIESNNKKKRLPKPENQSIENNFATANTSAKDINGKTKNQVKGKKGKVSRQL